MAARKTNIEFLPHEEWEKRPSGKFLKWVLTVGRYIVIVTELIVIIAFLSRFKLDRDLADLNESIKQKQAIITSSVPFEKKFLFLQKRLSTIEGLRKSQLAMDEVLVELASLIPIDVYLSGLNVSGKEFSLSATALSESGLATFLNNLRASSRFTNISVSQLSISGAQGIGIKFELRSELASGQKTLKEGP